MLREPFLPRRDNFIEQRKRRSMAPCVVDVDGVSRGRSAGAELRAQADVPHRSHG